MENGKRAEAIDGEIPLPEAIIQLIQSFLNAKQAAQTSILSKSWYNAWLTRPTLDFDESNFLERGHGDPNFRVRDVFSEFARQKMRRYKELNLKIEKFRLWMRSAEAGSYSLASELMVKALKMGANDLSFEFDPPTRTFVLPHDVLGAETLIRLSVVGCKIDRREDEKVSCSKLKSLELCRVCIGDDLVWDIVSSCPLIEKVLLSGCDHLVKVANSKTVGKMMTFQSPLIDLGKQNVESVVNAPIRLSEYHQLKSLFLERAYIDSSFFRDFSLKFPRLEVLALRYCYGYKRVEISSHSLECISLSQRRMLKASFDVPRIRKFSFSGSSLPFLSFTTDSREWESDISITWYCYHLTTSWFNELRRLLTKLIPSKISLTIEFYLDKQVNFLKDVPCSYAPVVENLMLWVQTPSSVCPALMDGLFSSCRPKVITVHWYHRSCIPEKANTDLAELLCETLMQRESKNLCSGNQIMFGLRDLEQVNVEVFEDALAEWRPLPWKTLFDAATGPENGWKIRFLLGWRP